MRFTLPLVLLFIVSALAGCGEEPGVRVYETAKRDAEPGPEPVAGPVALEGLVFQPPLGWLAGGSTQFVMASYESEDGTRLTVSKASGDLTSNINRWRGQLGLAPLTEPVETADLAQVDSPAGPVYVVDLSSNMVNPSARRFLVGLLADRGGAGQVWFFKIDGPSNVIDAQREGLDAMFGSFRWEQGGVVSDG